MGLRRYFIILLLAGMLALPAIASAANNTLWLASQHSWAARQGFFLCLEGKSDGPTADIKDLRLLFGIADGKVWRFAQAKPDWKRGHIYRVTATMGPDGVELVLDGERTGGHKYPLVPMKNRPVSANEVPSWMRSPTNYLVQQRTLRIEDGSGQKIELNLKHLSERPIPIQLLSPSIPQRLKWETSASETTTIEATFSIIDYPNVRDHAPLIDRWGQPIHIDFPNKVKSDHDLTQALADENQRLQQWPAPTGYDAYGGNTDVGWKEQDTGFYRVVKRDGYWHLITPEGNPCFYLGICGIPELTWPPTPVSDREYLFQDLPPKTAPYANAWFKNLWNSNDDSTYVCFSTSNLIRKYGEATWKDGARAQTAKRVAAWGFHGAGKWGGLFGDGAKDGAQERVSCVGYLRFGSEVPRVAGRPDVFDPTVRQAMRNSLTRQITPHLKNPWVIGWAIGNEYGEIIKPAEVTGMLASTAPAKRALTDRALEKIYQNDLPAMAAAWNVTAATKDELYASTPTVPADDVEHLRRFLADKYYEANYQTVKEIDPNHLYLGFWIVPGWWVNEEDWKLIGPHCDVFGFDRYDANFLDANLESLVKQVDKPILCGEFSFPTFYDGQRGYSPFRSDVKDENEAGRAYQRFVKQAAEHPYCVGVMWFTYRDQPVSGRGHRNARSSRSVAVGEAHAFGLVDLADRPKWEFVTSVRETNLSVPRWRAAAQSAVKSK